MSAPFLIPPPPKTGRLRRAARFVSGLELDGHRRTDARWAQRGTQSHTPHGRRASRWAHWPLRRRSTIRLGAALGAAAVPVGLATDVVSTMATLRVGAWGGLVTGGWAVWEQSRRYIHRRELIGPLAELLAGRLGDARYVLDPHTWISVPVDVQDRPTRIYLPATFTPNTAQETALVRDVARKIGLSRPDHALELRGERPFLQLIPAPAPRDRVTLNDSGIRELLKSAKEGSPVLGLAPRDQPFTLDLDAEAPHVGLSMATGAGKSVAGTAVLAQFLEEGGIALILDRKITSQMWAEKHPGVLYARSEEEIHTALMWASAEIDRRYRIVQEHADISGNVDPDLVGPRLLLVIEELNTLEMDIRRWWMHYREKVNGPASPPALQAIGRYAAMGRAARMHMLVISQKLTCQSIGGTAARENLSTRILGRATTSTWNMLAPECKVGGRYPRTVKIVGRVYVVHAGEATPVQVIYMTPQEALEYSLSGVVTAFPDLGEAGRGRSANPYGHDAVRQPHPGETGHDEAGDPDLGEAGPAPLDLVTLSDAAERLALTIKTLRNARDRDQNFPDPVESGVGRPSRYRFEDIELWALVRSSGQGGESE